LLNRREVSTPFPNFSGFLSSVRFSRNVLFTSSSDASVQYFKMVNSKEHKGLDPIDPRNYVIGMGNDYF